MRGTGTGRWKRVAGRAAGSAVVAVLALTGCTEDPTEPPFESGTVSFDWVEEGDDSPAVTWTATGSCGSQGFALGSATCAVGSEEVAYWATLGVLLLGDGEFGLITVAHPKEEGTCTASAAASSTCGLAFTPSYTGPGQQNVISYILTSGTVTVSLAEVDGVQRMTGTFEGRAEVPNSALTPVLITNGTFDVELVER